MKIKFLCSSSSGNATLITGVNENIMIDAGPSYKTLKEANGGLDLSVQALFITHEHGDHIKGAGVLGRKTDCAIYIPEKCYLEKIDLFDSCNIQFVEGGDEIDLEEFTVKAFSTRHDSVDSVGYIITEKSTGKKFAFLTDTGVITALIREHVKDCHIYFIESDYDEEELEKNAEYSDELKTRISSPYGHLSNQESLKYISSLNFDMTDLIVMGHLSKNTNSPFILSSRIDQILDKKWKDKIYIVENVKEFDI